MMDQKETFTASTEGRLAECLGLARALPAFMKALGDQTVLPAQMVIVEMLHGASLIALPPLILLMTVHLKMEVSSTA